MGVSERVARLAPSRAVRAQLAQATAQKRDAPIRHAAVALELRLAGAARADAAAEALEVLPHPAHARQVVLELGELDLELSLGGDGVLGEDVEDQLRPIDDTGGERVLERPLLHRIELVVDEQHLGIVVAVGRLQLLELALADVPARVGVCAPLDDLGDRVDAGGARELAELRELVVEIGALWQHREQQPTLGLRALPELGFACGHQRKYAAGRTRDGPGREIIGPGSPSSSLAAVTALADRLAERTLELVDIPSESRHEAAIRERLRSLVPAAFAAVFEGDEAFLWSRERRRDAPLLVLAGHYDTVPAQENVPGRIEDGAVHGCGASDMKGGVAVALELVRELAERDPGPVDVALLLFGAEELPPQDNPLPALFDACPLVHEAGLAVLLEPTDLTIQAGCVGNLTARVTFHGASGHSARPWLADNAIAPRDRRALPRSCARAARGGHRRAAVLRGRVGHPARGRCRGQRRARSGGRHPEPPLPARPLTGGRRGVPADARADRRDRRDRRELATRSGRPRRAARRTLCARQVPSRSSRSRRGRTSPTSRPGGSRPSTSGPVRPVSPTPGRAGRDRLARARVRRLATRRPRRDRRMTDR